METVICARKTRQQLDYAQSVIGKLASCQPKETADIQKYIGNVDDVIRQYHAEEVRKEVKTSRLVTKIVVLVVACICFI